MAGYSGPFLVCLQITSLCNLNCKHCLTTGASPAHDLTTDEMLSVIAQIKVLKVFKVVLFGREPLMRKDFFQILEALAELKIDLVLDTNGTLVTKGMAKKLSCYPINTYIVSLDGSSPQVQDPLRGRGSFRKNVNGIRNLVAHKCRVQLSATVTRYNYRDLAAMATLGKELGVAGFIFNDLLFTGKTASSCKKLCIPADDRTRFYDSLIELKAAFGDFVSGPVFRISRELIKADAAGKRRGVFPFKVKPCGAAVTKCAIRPDGWVTPCEFLWDVKAGDLREQSLFDIWHHSPVMKQLREGFEIEKEEVPECANCDYAAVCYEGPRCQTSFKLDNFKHKEFYCLRGDVSRT